MLHNQMVNSGVRLHGWHYDADFCQAKIGKGEMIHLLAETSNVCNQDCEYCYTVELTLDNDKFHSNQLPNELDWLERKKLIDEAASLGAVSYDVVGAGEPLVDPLFFKQIEYAASKNMIPIVFTNGSVLGGKKGPEYAQKLWELGASVVVKWHSSNHEIHDRIVGRQGAGKKRDQALQLLKEIGFNKTNPVRLGIDNIVYQPTISEIPDCLRMCREENLFLICSSFIPSGRTQAGSEKESSFSELMALYEECRNIDEKEFGITHSGAMPYVGYGKTCSQYQGLYITIGGEAFNCPGQSEPYGNIRQSSLTQMWQKRVKSLKQFDGGCPPRQQYYQQKENSNNLSPLF